MIEHKGIKPKYCNSMTRKRQASPGSVNTPWLEWAMNYINSVSSFK